MPQFRTVNPPNAIVESPVTAYPATMASLAKHTISATYTSPSQQKAFSISISTPVPSPTSPTAVRDKVAYLSELRASTKQLQEDINVFLTQKMEEDKVSVAIAGGKNGGGETDRRGEEEEVSRKSKEEIEEEKYGEEEEEMGEDA